jgi:predicted GNAT family N-acyltransferase
MQTQAPLRFTVRRTDWSSDQTALRAVRLAVFVHEQQVPEALEWDGFDDEAVHLIAESEDGRPIGTARLLTSGQIGRMAVLPDWRARGIGTRLLIELLRIATDAGYPTPFMHAQTAAARFYRALGFETAGEVFEEAGILHQRMVLNDQELPLMVDIQTRVLGQTESLFKLDSPRVQRHAVAALAKQARREIRLLSPDLEPILYDQEPFLEQISRLAVDRRGRLPVRILLIDAEPVLRRGHRLVELSRKLSSAIQIRAVPEEFAEQCDHYLLADDRGYCLRRYAAPRTVLLDFNDAAAVRRMQRGFDKIWEQGAVHIDLRRLHL